MNQSMGVSEHIHHKNDSNNLNGNEWKLKKCIFFLINKNKFNNL